MFRLLSTKFNDFYRWNNTHKNFLVRFLYFFFKNHRLFWKWHRAVFKQRSDRSLSYHWRSALTNYEGVNFLFDIFVNFNFLRSGPRQVSIFIFCNNANLKWENISSVLNRSNIPHVWFQNFVVLASEGGFVCEDGWLLYRDRCYFFSTYARNWYAARQECQDFGLDADLATIRVPEVDAFLFGKRYIFIKKNLDERGFRFVIITQSCNVDSILFS